MPQKRSRIPSGLWDRLRPAEQDSLESMGLPSKGEKRLLDHKTQEKYYTKIMERYLSFCTDAGRRDELLRRFEGLKLSESSGPKKSMEAAEGPSAEELQSSANTKKLSEVLMACRKLREGIVASRRADDWTFQVYLFCIRLSVLVKHPESYHPSIIHLLRYLASLYPLTSIELQEVLGYLVLDSACRRRELAEAYTLKRRYNVKDAKIDAVLHALVHDNYVLFRRMKLAVDGHQARIMDFAEDLMRMQTLRAFGKSYLSVDLEFLEATTDRKWDDLTKRDGVGWELDENKVMVRKIKAK